MRNAVAPFMLKQMDVICPPARLLGAMIPLCSEDRDALARATEEDVREVEPRRDIVREGDRPRSVLYVLQGWGCRYKQLADGRRQIVSIMLPGDMCDADLSALDRMDHSIGAISRVRVAEIGFDRFEALRTDSAAIAKAIKRYELVKIAIQREWTTNLGQRTALERIAHLLCELFLRLECVGETEGNACTFPLTQTDLADACGLTPVHVNRTIQELRREGLVAIGGKQLVIPDLAALKDRALFDPTYLHLKLSAVQPLRR